MRRFERMKRAHLRALIQRALAPVAIGLVLASGYTLAQAADRSLVALALTAAATAAIAFTRVNPVWVLAAAALVGVSGLA
jgi:chromate transporter